MKMNKGVCLLLSVMIMFTMTLTTTTAETTNSAGKLDGAIVLSIGSNGALVDGEKTDIDPNNTAVTPIAINGTTLVPVRFVSESLKADVAWDSSSGRVDITKDGIKISFTVGQLDYLLNNETKTLLTEPKLLNNRVLVPLRAIAEGFGKKVFYNRGLIIISDIENIYDPITDKGTLDSITMDKLGALPSLDSFENFSEMVKLYNANDSKKYYNSGGGGGGGIVNGVTDGSPSQPSVSGAPVPTPTSAPTTESSAISEKSTDGGTNDFSGTNLQVQGVDEADVIKTDGTYIYKVSQNKLSIAKAMPAEAMEISNTITFDNNTYYPLEMYVDGDKLALIGNYYEYQESQNKIMPAEDMKMAVPGGAAVGYRNNTFTRIDIYDISNKSNPNKIRSVDVEGNYTTSRKIGGSIYLVSNSFYYSAYDDKGELIPQNVQPLYRDTMTGASGTDMECVDYANIKYFPGCIGYSNNYMNVMGIDINQQSQEAQISSYLGGSENVYCSADNMYVVAGASVQDGEETLKVQERDAKGNITTIDRTFPKYKYVTKAYKFALSAGQLTYQTSADIDGNILNQFSMDEYKGDFRIATTTWDNKGGQSNNLFTFDKNLKPLGEITNIAPGERIYSVRFMGDKAYMVTFRQVDPLFVIDVADSANPKILGQLKIPGYSDYLHPYDETHIIGFGKNADDSGRFGGMKMAIFDVSDFANPKEMYTEFIGDRGTESPLLHNHKALLFSKEKNLLAFPVSLYEIPENYKNNKNAYGVFKYQGLYVYDISLENGFSLRGRISHITDDEYKKFGNDLSYSVATVERGLYINNNLYTISNYGIMANDLNTLDYKGTVMFK